MGVEDNLAFSKLLFVDDNLEITVNKERLRVERAGISNSDYFSKFKLESLNNNNKDEALFYAYIKNNELVKVHKACENAINETKGLATDKDIGPIILYDNLLFRYKLETSFGVRVRY